MQKKSDAITYREAIAGLKLLKRDFEMKATEEKPFKAMRWTIKTAINAMEEVQQYHKIGTIEECRIAVEKMKSSGL